MDDLDTLPSGSISIRRRVLRIYVEIARRCTALMPLLAWLYVGASAYLLIGVSAFPAWWRRFFFGGGFSSLTFWRYAVHYLTGLVTARQPLGVVLVGLFLLSLLWTVYTAGRVSVSRIIREVKPPSRRLLTLATCIIALLFISLPFVQEEFQMPEELSSSFQQLRHSLDQFDDDDAISSYFQPDPPKSGFFFYLDPSKVGQTYSVLQKDLTVALATTTNDGTRESGGVIDLKAIGGQFTTKERLERSVQLAATAPTPARQAEWLIKTYKELSLPVHLPMFADPSQKRSYALTSAIGALKDRNVTLTSEQIQAASIGDAVWLEKKLGRPNTPLLYSGSIRLSRYGRELHIRFETGGGGHLICDAVGNAVALDQNISPCAPSEGGCVVDANVLGIIWRVARTGTTIRVDFVPLALW